MFKLSSLFALTAFALWLLPLGTFIKPSQEKIACGGKRAVHMCCMTGKVRQGDKPVAVAFGNASSVAKGAASGSAPDDFLADKRKVFFRESWKPFRDVSSVLPLQPYLHRLDAVPKA